MADTDQAPDGNVKARIAAEEAVAPPARIAKAKPVRPDDDGTVFTAAELRANAVGLFGVKSWDVAGALALADADGGTATEVRAMIEAYMGHDPHAEDATTDGEAR